MNTGADRQVTRRACGSLYKMLGLLCSDREEVRSIFLKFCKSLSTCPEFVTCFKLMGERRTYFNINLNLD